MFEKGFSNEDPSLAVASWQLSLPAQMLKLTECLQVSLKRHLQPLDLHLPPIHSHTHTHTPCTALQTTFESRQWQHFAQIQLTWTAASTCTPIPTHFNPLPPTTIHSHPQPPTSSTQRKCCSEARRTFVGIAKQELQERMRIGPAPMEIPLALGTLGKNTKPLSWPMTLA